MSVASWFRFAKFHFSAAATKPSRRRTPIRLSLEQLEERAVPDANAGNVLGNLNNPTLNGNLPSSGLVLTPNPTVSALEAVAVGTFFNGLTLPNQGQQVSGLANVLSNVPTSIFFSSLGFGAGTQPNQPWVPNAYNLGLANGQFNFPTVADFGNFQSFGIRYPRLSRLPQAKPDADRPEQLLPPRDALASADTPDMLPQEEGADNLAEIDSDGDLMLLPIPLVPHAATEAVKGEAPAARKEQASTVEQNLPEEEAIPDAHVWEENVFTHREAVEEKQFLDSELVHDVPPLESLNLPSTLLLTVLTPAQLLLLLAEFPVSADPSERGEELAEFSEQE